MNIYNLLTQFWRATEFDGVTGTEAALYHFLLYLANSNRWKMPFTCPTAVLTQRLLTSKQNVLKARQSLMERGFITFTSGINKKDHAQYTIFPTIAVQPVSMILKEKPTGESLENGDDTATKEPEAADAQEQPAVPAAIVIDAGNDKEKSLRYLWRQFSEDSRWLSNVVVALRSPVVPNVEELRPWLYHFFESERAKGVKAREEADCRSHFFNWLKIQIKNKKTKVYDTEKHADPRRGVEAAPREAQNVNRPF